MVLSNSIFYYFDKNITELIGYEFIYKQISENCIKCIDSYNESNEFIITILPGFIKNKLSYFIEIVSPICDSKSYYKTKFSINNVTIASEYLNTHIKHFVKKEERNSLIDNFYDY